MLRINRASPPIHTGLSGKGALLAALTWPLSRPPALAHQHHLPFRRYAEATPGVGSLPSPPGASTHAFRATRPAAPPPRRPAPRRPSARRFPAQARAQTALCVRGAAPSGPEALARLRGRCSFPTRPQVVARRAPARRSPSSWGTPSACTAAADPDAAPRSPAPGPRRSEGPCPDAARRPGRCSAT